MIIECVNCSKKFSVNADLIPSAGRTIQCGSCNHVWFYNPKKLETTLIKKIKPSNSESQKKVKSKRISSKISDIESNKKIEKKNYELTRYKTKSNFSFSKLLSFIIVILVSFVALIILLDTFKNSLYEQFPNLETALFSLFEILKDIELFIKDLF